VADLTSMLLTVGTELEEADMGDAFVDAWTVANMVSDLLLARMGREVCCAAPEFSPDQQVLMTEGRSSSPAPATEEYGEADATKAVDALTLLEAAGAAAPAPSQRADTRPLLNPQMPPAFFTMDALHDAAEAYLDEFARFDFMRKFLEGGHEGAWDQANIIMALLLGFRCALVLDRIGIDLIPMPTMSHASLLLLKQQLRRVGQRGRVGPTRALPALAVPARLPGQPRAERAARGDLGGGRGRGQAERPGGVFGGAYVSAGTYRVSICVYRQSVSQGPDAHAPPPPPPPPPQHQVMVGKAYYHQANPSDEDFASRATLVKWIYEHDFVNEFRNLPSVQAVLGVKARIVEKREGEKPPPRYLY